MTTQKKQKGKLVPKLRFKGFDGEWEKKHLGQFADVSKLAGYEFTKHIVYQDEGEIIALRALNIKNNSLDLSDVKYIDNSELSMLKRSKLYIDDLMFTYIGTIGEVALIPVNERFYLAPNVARIRINKGEVIANFICQYFTNSNFKNIEVKKYIATSSQPSLTMENVRKFEVNLPTLPEQQKISSFLSSVDEKLSQLTRKKERLALYKKGVMQQLFSGSLRFKDENGKEFKKWEERFYGDIYSFHSTNSLSREKLNYEVGSVKNIHYGDIHTKFSTLFDVKKELVPFVNDDVDISKIKEENFCQEGDLVIADASEDYEDIGKAIELFDLNDERIIAGLHTFLARPNKEKIQKGYSGYLMKAPYVRAQIMTIAQGTKVLSISTGRLANVKLAIPCLPEQQKIATFLSSIDLKITAITAQISQTQSFKKGLLQQMFV